MKKKSVQIICFVMAAIFSSQTIFPAFQVNATDDLSSSSIASSELVSPLSVASSSEQEQLSSSPSSIPSHSSDPSSIESVQSQSHSNTSSAKSRKANSSMSSVPSFIWTDAMTTTVDNACKWLTLNDTNQHYLLVMGIAGKSADITVTTREQQNIAQKEGGYDNPDDLSLDILSLVFSGMNPENFQGLNLIKSLYEYQNLSSMDAMSNALALIAFDSNQFPIPNDALNTRDSIVENLLQTQKEDGSFDLDEATKFQTTAMTLSALAPYQKRNDVQAGIQSALTYLQKQLNQMKNIHCDTLSYLTIALSSLKIPADDGRFTSGNENLVNSIMKYQLSNGSFAVDKSAQQPDVFSTALAICAMIAAQNQESPFILQNGIAYAQQNKTDHSPLVFLLVVLAILLIAAVLTCIFVIKKRKKSRTTRKEQSNDKSNKTDSTSQPM